MWVLYTIATLTSGNTSISNPALVASFPSEAACRQAAGTSKVTVNKADGDYNLPATITFVCIDTTQKS